MATLLRPEHLRADSFDAAEVLVVSAAERDVHESDKRFVEQKLRQAYMEDPSVILPATSDIAPNDNLAEGVAGIGKRSEFALPLVIIGHRPCGLDVHACSGFVHNKIDFAVDVDGIALDVVLAPGNNADVHGLSSRKQSAA